MANEPPRKILVAPNGFKESLSAFEVARRIAAGLTRASPVLKIIRQPLADGGVGTAEVVIRARHGEIRTAKVCDPRFKKITARFGIVRIRNKKTAVIELAQAAGLSLIPEKSRDPMMMTTRGVGELIIKALQDSCRAVILTVGDSATVDCGVGAMTMMGIRFLDAAGHAVKPGCRGLLNLARIDSTGLLPALKDIKIDIATDVDNRLTGDDGAIAFARQKGARREQLPVIEKALQNFKNVVRRDFHKDIDKVRGAGAAGGVAGGMNAIMGSNIRSGFNLVKDSVRLEEKVRACDIVITGEGRIDLSSLQGKTIGGVIRLARKYRKPVILTAGSVDRGAMRQLCRSVGAVFCIQKKTMNKNYTMKNCADLLESCGCAIGKMILRKNIGNKDGSSVQVFRNLCFLSG